jgi:hypothetical protein
MHFLVATNRKTQAGAFSTVGSIEMTKFLIVKEFIPQPAEVIRAEQALLGQQLKILRCEIPK